jgi:hypothetical protein
MEFGFNPHLARKSPMLGANPVCRPGIVLIEEFSGEQSALYPPGIAIDEKGAIARGGQHDVGGGTDFFRMPQFMDLRKQERWIGSQGSRNGGREIVAPRFGDRRRVGLDERHDIAAG